MPNFSISYYLTAFLPDCLGFGKREHRIIRDAADYLDLVKLIKKQKVAMRNL